MVYSMINRNPVKRESQKRALGKMKKPWAKEKVFPFYHLKSKSESIGSKKVEPN